MHTIDYTKLDSVTNHAIGLADQSGKVDALGAKVSAEYAEIAGSAEWITDADYMEPFRMYFIAADVFGKDGKKLMPYIGNPKDTHKFYRDFKASKAEDHRKAVFAKYQHDGGVTEKVALEKGLTLENFKKALRESENRATQRWAKVMSAARRYAASLRKPEAEPESETDKAYRQWNGKMVRGVEQFDAGMMAFFNKYAAKDKATFDKLEPTMREVARNWKTVKEILKASAIVITE